LISGARIQKRPLTHPRRAFPGSACVSAATVWQGLDAPLIVELFTVCVLGRTPEVVGLRLVGVATARLPTPACVKRTCRALHPIGHHGFGPSPAGGFAVQAPRTRFGHDRPAASQRQACPARPPSSNHHGIESGDYSAFRAGLLPKASLELDDPLSWKIQLYGTLAWRVVSPSP